MVVGQKVFAADFYQGWPATNDPTAKIRIIGGRYVFEIGPFDARFVTTTAVNHRDTYTQVEATPDRCIEGNDGGYGLLFRYVDANNYFLITFFCDNTFSVIARVAGSIVSGGFVNGPLPDSLDATTARLHTIGIRSKGNTHTLYFDSQEIGSFDTANHEKGDVGLYAVSSGTGVIVVGFDNLQVWTVP